ncbi:MAG TPA: hypothetical protein VF244_08205, partial [Acidimicrobiales bacterium]
MSLTSRNIGIRSKLALLLAVLAIAGLSWATPGGAALGDSPFEATDGDQVVASGTDWESFLGSPNLFTVPDLGSGSTDDSLAGGTKDNTECPNVSLGSIPGTKDDLLRFYLAHETLATATGPETFLYLGYVRALPGGNTASAHGVFELNKGDAPCPDFPAKGKTPGGPSPFVQRTAGDVRISFDDEGGDSPIISFETWLEPCPGGGAGCWSTKTALPADKAEGAFNEVSVSDRLNGDAPTTLSLVPQSFSEAKVNLNLAGLLDPNDCEGFSKASLYTGASGNSDKEQSKDFIAPEPINLNSCQPATVNVLKTFTVAAPGSDAVFDLYYDTDGSGTISTDDEFLDSCTIAAADVSDTDNDGEFEGTCSFADLLLGTGPFGALGPHTVIVTESTVPTGFTGGADVPVTFTFGNQAQSFDVSFVNSPEPGDVDLAKIDDGDPAAPVAGATFTLYKDDGGTPGQFDG